jgi:hypothetical protein
LTVSATEFSTDGARAAAGRDELADWVARFLASPGSDNAPLGEQLTRDDRCWFGPVQVPIDQLHRLAGPPGAPVLQPLADDEWRDDVDELARHINADGVEPPPVIVTHRDDALFLEDGNHRVEALRRAGVEEAWAIIGFDSTERRDRFVTQIRSA